MSASAIEWTDAVDLPGCMVSNTGLIRGPRRERQQQTTRDGYRFVHVYRRGAGKNGARRNLKVWVHRAVLEAFVGPCPDGLEARHLDGNPANNNLTNLRWGTRVEQAADRRRHGTAPYGARVYSARLTPTDVQLIRDAYRTVPLRSLAARFGVSHTAVRRAAVGLTWREVA